LAGQLAFCLQQVTQRNDAWIRRSSPEIFDKFVSRIRLKPLDQTHYLVAVPRLHAISRIAAGAKQGVNVFFIIRACICQP
jgi:hypothetical protein